MRVTSEERWDIYGIVDVSNGTIIFRDGQITRAKLTEESLNEIPVLLASCRVWDNMTNLLPQAGATDDLAIIDTSWGTDAVTLQSADADGTTILAYARFQLKLPPEYIAAQTVTLRITCGMITNVADDTAVIDVECYEDDDEGGISSDLCATAEQSFNSLTKATKDFTITPTALTPGSILDFRIKIDITDASTGAAVIGEISRMALRIDIKG